MLGFLLAFYSLGLMSVLNDDRQAPMSLNSALLLGKHDGAISPQCGEVPGDVKAVAKEENRLTSNAMLSNLSDDGLV